MSQWGTLLSRGWPSPAGLRRTSHTAPASTSSLRALLESLGPPMRAKENGNIHVPLGKGWVLEPKYDGDRGLGGRLENEFALVGKGGSARFMMSQFPEVAGALRKLKRDAVLDGEVVAFDAAGRSHHRTVQTSKDRRFVAFDLLWLEGRDLRALPLSDRRALLEALVLETADPQLLLAERLPGTSVEAVAEICRRRGEGVMAKRESSPYQSDGQRSPSWLKLKPRWTQPMAISGYAVQRGQPPRVRQLHLRDVQGDRFDFAGSVPPRDPEEAAELLPLLAAERPDPQAPMRSTEVLEPRHVVQVSYPVWVPRGPLAHVSLLGARTDLQPLDCVRAAALPLGPEVPTPPAPIFPPIRAPGVKLRRDVAVTRGQLRSAYEATLPRLAPFLRHRPVTFEAASTRASVRTDGAAALEAVLANDALSVSVANHTETSPWQPDWMVFRLAPRRGAAMPRLAEAAQSLHKLLTEVGLVSFAKTGGTPGASLDVVVPLAPPLLHAEVQKTADQIAGALTQEPKLAALFRTVRIDTSGNGPEATMRAPCAPGSDAAGTLSWPLAWEQVNARLRVEDYTVAKAPAQVAAGPDPWAEFFNVQQALPRVE